MALVHTAAGVNEIARNIAVAPSAPQPAAQQARATATTTTVPPNRSSGGAPNV